MPPKRFHKKNAVTFELVRRSQKDPLISDETKNQYVLRPVLKHGQTLPKDFMVGGCCLNFSYHTKRNDMRFQKRSSMSIINQILNMNPPITVFLWMAMITQDT